jgi:peptide/nickel transport system ATP-binding protein
MPRLQVEKLSVTRPAAGGSVSVLSNVSFNLQAGEMVGLVGESGSGKSMTLMSILGLNPVRGATISGSIRFDGNQLLGAPPRLLRSLRGRSLAMIFQDPGSALNARLTIGEQIGEVFRIHRQVLSASERRARILHLLEEVRFADAQTAVDSYPHELSGGMQQRALIAMALALQPKLLLADEPTTALDVTIQAQIMDILRRINVDYGSSILLVTHDIALAASLCDRILVMYAGEIVEEGPAREIVRHPAHPYTAGLLSCLPVIGQHRPPLPIRGEVPHAHPVSAVGCRFAERCPLVQDACRSANVEYVTAATGHLARCLRVESATGTPASGDG